LNNKGPRAKKSYGQHFLKDDTIARRIVEKGLFHAQGLPILEVGPGKGVLTRYLLESGIDFRAVEADREMFDYLTENYSGLEDRVILADFLRLDLDKIFPGRAFMLFGNFPYNISSQILIRMIRFRSQIPVMVGMFQREVAERVVAPSGSKVYGRISVMVQAYYSGKILFGLKPGSFVPPPKVDSSVILLERKADTEITCDESLFRQVVSLGFSQRRKMLRNSLKGLVNDNDFLQQDVFTRRPEQLSVQEFIELTKTITKYKENESGKQDQ